jgi:propionyl-CoA carboxylase alpha chain
MAMWRIVPADKSLNAQDGQRLRRVAVVACGSLAQPSVFIAWPGGQTTITQQPVGPLRRKAVAALSDDALAPMAARVLRVHVEPGQTVAADEVLVVLEAMKMEHRLLAPRAGVIASVQVKEGDQVACNAVIVRMVPN